MKKLHILIPSLLAIASMPLVSMVSCNKGEVAPTNIAIDKTETTIMVGQSVQLTAAVEPEGVSGKVTWTSSDDSVAVVSSNGKVTGLKKGTATITVKPDGYDLQATCKVTVTKPDPTKESIIIEGLWNQFEGNYYIESQTNQFSTYLLRGEEKIDISSDAIFHFNLGDKLSYDDTNKCIKWSKELLPGLHTVETSVEYWSMFSDPVTFTINIKTPGTLRVENLPGSSGGITITPGQSGQWGPMPIWYDFDENVSVDVTALTDVDDFRIDELWWNRSMKQIEWSENFIFIGEHEMDTTFIAVFGTAEFSMGFLISKG